MLSALLSKNVLVLRSVKTSPIRTFSQFQNLCRNDQHLLNIPKSILMNNQNGKHLITNSLRRVFFSKIHVDSIQMQKNRYVGYWLLTCSGLTFVTICIGGITRLTESGLSMVDWHPFKEIPPFTQDQWEKEFEKYKQYPEFKIKNKEITLEQFKKIWYMEYAHRMLGRTIGALYFIPAFIFWRRNWFNRSTKIRVGIFGSLIVFQGLLGWYMVKSGLEDKEVFTHEPRVSQYRLAAHLGTAMLFYTMIFYNGLVNIMPDSLRTNLPPVTKQLIRYKRLVGISKLFIFTTALSGAFVAGLDAGLVYNSWPKMADRWIPSDMLRMDPLWKNLFENPSCVQFVHRHLGETTGLFMLGLWAYSMKVKLPTGARVLSHLLALGVLTQIGLGITALLKYVPIEIASAHQANAMLTLTIALWLSKELRWVKKIAK